MKSRWKYWNTITALLVFILIEWLTGWKLYAAETCDKIAFAPPQYFPTGGSPLNVAVAAGILLYHFTRAPGDQGQ